MNDKSFELFSKEHASGEKFDYFICSVSGALFAYIGQTYTPHILSSWYFFLMPIALYLLSVSFAFSTWLLRFTKEITKLNKEYVSYTEANEALQNQLLQTDKKTGKPMEFFVGSYGETGTRKDLVEDFKNNRTKIADWLKESQAMDKEARKLEWARSITLGIAFLLIFLAKFLQPYFEK
jgi:hypothetical protein